MSMPDVGGTEVEGVGRSRVLFVCSGLDVGGAQRQWSLLIPALSPQFQISVLTLVSEGSFFHKLSAEGVTVSCAHMRGRADLAGLRRALRHVEFRPHLVVTQSINAHIVGHLIARRVGAAHVANEHAGPGLPTRFHREALTRFVGSRVDDVIAVSGIQVPRLIKQGFPSSRIRVIRNGIEAAVPTATAPVVRAGVRLGSQDFVAILVATLRVEKSGGVFVRAVQSAHRADSRVRGLVAGGGPELDRLRKLAGRDRVVQMLGERHDVADLVRAADVACLSSTAEGVPMALLEAMALAKPIVATNVGGVPEAVEAGTTGLLVPVGDEVAFEHALLRLVKEPELARRLGDAGRRRQEEMFGVERMIREYRRAFDDVLAARRSR
jgi:glycosyltransferase involved in cell wall biosynthesis